MNIAQYINELLIDNDCVIVPSLGGFVANIQSAMVSGNAHVSFVPPSKQLLFNVKLNHNDGLLVSHVSSKNQISYKQAEDLIMDFSHGIKKQLHSTGTFTFEGIGVLLLNSHNAIEFESTEASILADSFGLSSFMFPQLNYGIRAKQHVSFKTSSPKRKIVVKKYVQRVAVIVPMLLLLAILPTVYLRNIQESSLSIFKAAKTEKVVIAKPIILGKTIAVVKPAITEKVEFTSVQTPSYHIIIGCFKNIQTAQNLCDTYKSKGFKSTILTINGFYKVSLQSFNDMSDANNLLISFQDANPRFADSWIMTN